MMQKLKIGIVVSIFSLLLLGCSKKVHPSASENKSEEEVVGKKENTVIVEKEKTTVVKTNSKKLFPKVISVNDAAAQKSVDGRLYYDVMNHRYWKNYKDGKYYLYNKSMYKNPDFKPRDN